MTPYLETLAGPGFEFCWFQISVGVLVLYLTMLNHLRCFARRISEMKTLARHAAYEYRMLMLTVCFKLSAKPWWAGLI